MQPTTETAASAAASTARDLALNQPRSHAPSPDHILQTGLGFWASKTLLSAVELGVFTELAKGPLDAEALRQRLGLHPRSAQDFFDSLVALKFLERSHGKYSNSADSDFFLDRNKATYAGGILEMSNTRLYGHWGALTEGLRTGQPQNESKTGESPFKTLYSTPEKLENFLRGMTGISLGAAMAIADKFPWRERCSFADIGTAQGAVPVQLARKHPHLEGIGYDLPPVQPVFEKYVRANHVADRVRFQVGDFFKDPLPKVDVLIMGHILHDWDLEQKRALLAKAYAALPPGGALIVYEALIDDDRRHNAFGLLMSLNMLIETPGGFDYTGHDCQGWMRSVGFKATWVEHLVGPDSMVVGIK
ncbi:MAG TPA: methyltransferase [Verrucomicrobiae bacterium]|nr:methyltransferase [Verrucomicrobiae bacterium]